MNSYNKKQRLHSGNKDLESMAYGKVEWWESESGHSIGFVDGENPSMIFASESGSYVMMTSDGKVINFAVGDSQNYSKGGISLTIDENNDIKIHGHNRMVVGGGSYIEVAGDAGVAVGGSTTLVSKGNLNAHVDNIYLGAKGNMRFNVDGNMDMKVSGNMSTEVGGSSSINVSDSISQKSSKYAWEADTSVKGNMAQDGIHTDSIGRHDA